MIRRVGAMLAPTAVLALAAGCGSAATAGPTRVTVLAATSLRDVFTEIGREYEAAHDRHRVSFTFAASSTLARQVVAGAPADVLATADETTMRTTVDAGVVRDPAPFARNRLAILVPRGNPGRIERLADLTRPGLVVVLCDVAVPCGRAVGEALDRAGVTLRPASRESNVSAVVTKVRLGEADVGIGYVTDASDDLAAVPIEAAIVTYPIAAITPAGSAFVAWVRSARGRAVLARHGFLDP